MAKQKTLTRSKKTKTSKKTKATNKVDGVVESIGDKGQLITSISNGELTEAGQDESVSVRFFEHETLGVYPENHGQPDATLVASLGSSGFLEIEIVGVSISAMLGIKKGVTVSVSF